MTDNERDAEAQRALRNLRGLVDAPSEWRAEYRKDWETVAAALSAATTERDEALADRDGARRGEDEAWEKWQVAERRAEALAAQLQQAREFIARARPLLGIGLGNSLGKQADDLYVAIGAALAAAAPATTLNEPGGEA